MRTPVLLAVLALAFGPAAAGAQQSPFAPLPSAPTTGTPTVVVAPPPSTGGGGGLQGWQQALIFGAGAVLLAGIGWAIVSDARSRAPVGDAERAHPGVSERRHNRSQRQRERARAKARAGRRQRRRAQRRR